MTVSNFTGYLPSYLGFSQAPQALTAAGAVSVTHAITTIATGAGNIALTLPAGTTGQVKFITMITDGGGVATLTPAILNGYATIAFGDDGDSVMLMYLDGTSGWTIISNQGCTLA